MFNSKIVGFISCFGWFFSQKQQLFCVIVLDGVQILEMRERIFYLLFGYRSLRRKWLYCCCFFLLFLVLRQDIFVFQFFFFRIFSFDEYVRLGFFQIIVGVVSCYFFLLVRLFFRFISKGLIVIVLVVFFCFRRKQCNILGI